MCLFHKLCTLIKTDFALECFLTGINDGSEHRTDSVMEMDPDRTDDDELMVSVEGSEHHSCTFYTRFVPKCQRGTRLLSVVGWNVDGG